MCLCQCLCLSNASSLYLILFTRFHQVETLVAEVSVLQAMCDNTTDIATQTSEHVSSATAVVASNEDALDTAVAAEESVSQSLDAVSSTV